MQNFIVGLINEFPVESQLGSISITREPSKTTYTVGETLSTAGMTVTAKYNNGKSKTVTGYQVNGSTSSAGRQQVKVSYTEGGITKSASFYIQVNRRQVKTATLTYDANGGTGAPGAQTAEVNSSIRLSSSRPVKSYTVYLNAGGGTVTPGKIPATIFSRAADRNGAILTQISGQMTICLMGMMTRKTTGKMMTRTAIRMTGVLSNGMQHRLYSRKERSPQQ